MWVISLFIVAYVSDPIATPLDPPHPTGNVSGTEQLGAINALKVSVTVCVCVCVCMLKRGRVLIGLLLSQGSYSLPLWITALSLHARWQHLITVVYSEEKPASGFTFRIIPIYIPKVWFLPYFIILVVGRVLLRREFSEILKNKQKKLSEELKS